MHVHIFKCDDDCISPTLLNYTDEYLLQYMCVCIYIYIHTCIYIYIYVYIYVYITHTINQQGTTFSGFFSLAGLRRFARP